MVIILEITRFKLDNLLNFCLYLSQNPEVKGDAVFVSPEPRSRGNKEYTFGCGVVRKLNELQQFNRFKW